ncbi:RNA-binding protein [Ligilactobacillus ceti]|uniref:Rna binding protein n=1 Tax=Ligilactobacillus ceti DSM 22408 TaxID=1122146 RepID=A0A0R2KIF0_9LACO|nr:YlmH/Sll1252 family protein [Ligilactobacillus ceti]KRN88955.1 rna binding protein [Ligilactobacillus ceti DSM 22408]
MRKDIYQHFRKEEIGFIDEVLTDIYKVKQEYCPILTHFLDPRQQYIVETLVASENDVKVAFSGGYIESERKRALIYPEYYTVQDDDFELAVLQIKYPQKFAQLHHRHVLGTLVNSGLERFVLGDIITDGTTWQFVVEKQLASYYINQVQQIGKVKVRIELSNQAIIKPVVEYEEAFITANSMRLDTLIANVYNISRQRTKELINAKVVTLNWMTIDKLDYEVAEHDIISVRGFGRIAVKEVLGKTKKDKFKILVAVLNKKAR